MNSNYQNNKVFVRGTIVSNYKFSHQYKDEKFYLFDLEVERKSGVLDILPVLVSERLVDVTEKIIGRTANIWGEFRSHNLHEEEKTKLILNIFCLEIEFCKNLEDYDNNNKIEIQGFICKTPIYRTTPLGKRVADLLIAVNGQYSRSSYIPCLVWGRNAIFSQKLDVGTKLSLTGRIQSRNYEKKMPDGSLQSRTAYEVSAYILDVI